tara:strand:+ start:383 stop:1243 length:861 start_codon:yes stop_codon:yes gene_type:complete
MAFVTVGIIVAGAGGLAKLGVSLAGRRGRINEQAAAKAEMQKMKKEYKNLDTSNLAAGFKNPYANMENTMEDLTVNKQQAEFQAQQNQQNQANIMQGMQGAAGGSGIASLAQAMANQGQLTAQKASASIGMQEAQNQKLSSQQAAKNQMLEGKGEMVAQQMRTRGAETARGLEYQKTSTLFGMSQQRTAAANQARSQASADQMSAVGDIASAGASIATAGMKIPKLPGGDVVGGVGSTSFYPGAEEQGPSFYGEAPQGTYSSGGQSNAPGYNPLLKKKDLKINKNK